MPHTESGEPDKLESSQKSLRKSLKKEKDDGSESRVIVSVRVRPLSDQESRRSSDCCIRCPKGQETVFIADKSLPEISSASFPPGTSMAGGGLTAQGTSYRSFAFDHVFDPDSTQDLVYATIGRPVLESSFAGYHTCIFAYGQTGSGKSYCMMGSGGGREFRESPGIIPRLCAELFAQTQEKKETAAATGEQLEVTVLVSYLEIYHERVRCLLSEDHDALASSQSDMRSGRRGYDRRESSLSMGTAAGRGDVLRIREHPTLGVYVEGLAEVPVTSATHMLRLMELGNKRRHTSATKMNDTSSRSHAIFTIQLAQKRIFRPGHGGTGEETPEEPLPETHLSAKMNLVDLAGSERAKATGAEGETLREGAQINLSLTTLGLVIKALAEESVASSRGGPAGGGRRRHIPYRDSTLTFLLKECLGGNSKTYMLATVSPALINSEESLGTLRYADRAKAIVTKAFINESAGDRRIRELEDEVKTLREKIRVLEERGVLGFGGFSGGLAEVVHTTEAPERKNSQSIELPSTSGGDAETVHSELEDLSLASSSAQHSQKRLSITAEREAATDTPQQAESLLAELWRAEQIIKQLTIASHKGSPLSLAGTVPTSPWQADRAEEEDHDTESHSFNAQTPTMVHLRCKDPYLMNIDGAGNWVVAALRTRWTYMGAPPLQSSKSASFDSSLFSSQTELDQAKEGDVKEENEMAEYIARGDEAQYVPLLVDDDDVDVGRPHCIFTRFQVRASTTVRCCRRRMLYIMRRSERTPLIVDAEKEVQLCSGDVIDIGGHHAQIKYMDPEESEVTARGRRAAAFADRLLGASTQLEEEVEEVSYTAIGEKDGGDTHAEDDEEDFHSADSSIFSKSGDGLVYQEDNEQSNESFIEEDDRSKSDHCSAPSSPPPPKVPLLQLGGLLKAKGISSAAADAPVTIPVQKVLVEEPPPPSPSTAEQDPPVEEVRRPQWPPASVARHLHGAGDEDEGLPGGAPSAYVSDAAPVFVGRYNVAFLGASGSGKSLLIQNLTRKDGWLANTIQNLMSDIRGKQDTVVAPTVGIAMQSTTVESEPNIRLQIYELGGATYFRGLMTQLPHRRVIYVLCVPLYDASPLECVREQLEGILCHTNSHTVSLVLVGTFADAAWSGHVAASPSGGLPSSIFGSPARSVKQQARGGAAMDILDELERQIHGLIQLLQPYPECRPTVIGRFAVSNMERCVYSRGFRAVTSFPDLLQWLGDHAANSCRTDPEFAGGFIPAMCLRLSKRLASLRLHGTWSLPWRDYRVCASTTHAAYQHSKNNKDAYAPVYRDPAVESLTSARDEPQRGASYPLVLQQHTRLLTDWGCIQFSPLSATLSDRVFLDPAWITQLLSSVSCVPVVAEATHGGGHFAQHSKLAIPAVNDVAAERERKARKEKALSLIFNGAPKLFDVVTVASLDTGDNLRYGIVPLPLLCEMLTHRITLTGMTPLTSSALLPSFSGRRAEAHGRSSTHNMTLDEMLTLLLDYDVVFSGNRLRHSPRIEASPDLAPETPTNSSRPSFLLFPSAFTSRPSSAITQLLPLFLSGPFYRFSFNMVPSDLFPRLICRLSRIASGVYAGPCEPPSPPMRQPTATTDAGASSRDSFAAFPTFSPQRPRCSEGSRDMASGFWKDAVWLSFDAQPGTSDAHGAAGGGGELRVLLRLVGHSLFLTFHASQGSFHSMGRHGSASTAIGTEGGYYQGVLRSVRDVVTDFPGVRCKECVLCFRSYDALMSVADEHPTMTASMEEEGQAYYSAVTEDTNSLEKLRMMEKSALFTARSARGEGGAAALQRQLESGRPPAEDLIPYLRDFEKMPLVDAEIFANTRVRHPSPTPFSISSAARVKAAIARLNEAFHPSGQSEVCSSCVALDALVDSFADVAIKLESL